MIQHPDRVFQVWSYRVGMSRLLLRSVKSDSFRSRIDILFQSVVALSLPTLVFDGISIDNVDEGLGRLIIRETGKLPDDDITFFAIDTGGKIGYVAAGAVIEKEDDREYNEPSLIAEDL